MLLRRLRFITCSGVRTNSASKKFEVITSFFVGSFATLAQAKEARERFIAKVDKLRTA